MNWRTRRRSRSAGLLWQDAALGPGRRLLGARTAPSAAASKSSRRYRHNRLCPPPLPGIRTPSAESSRFAAGSLTVVAAHRLRKTPEFPPVRFFDRLPVVFYIHGGWRYRPASLAVRRMDALVAWLRGAASHAYSRNRRYDPTPQRDPPHCTERRATHALPGPLACEAPGFFLARCGVD